MQTVDAGESVRHQFLGEIFSIHEHHRVKAGQRAAALSVSPAGDDSELSAGEQVTGESRCKLAGARNVVRSDAEIRGLITDLIPERSPRLRRVHKVEAEDVIPALVQN